MSRVALLIILALIGAKAHGASWQMPNKSGGYIILTDRPCSLPGGSPFRDGYAYAQNGQVVRFCWSIVDNLVRAVYADGSEYAYNVTSFVPVQEARAK